MSKQNIGTVIQVTGPVLDIRFADGQLPDLLNAIEIDNQGKKLVVEAALAACSTCWVSRWTTSPPRK